MSYSEEYNGTYIEWQLDKKSLKEWRELIVSIRDERLIRNVMRIYPDKIAIEIIERRVDLEQTFNEISQALHIPISTLHYKYKNAIKRIKNICECRKKKDADR